jgi:hypothetical protein
MENSKNITVIIPVHELNKETTKILKNAIKSVDDNTMQPQHMIVVAPIKLLTKLKFLAGKAEVYLHDDADTSFQNQVNKAVKHVETPYFMVVEMDDELPTYAIEIAESYIKVDTINSENTGMSTVGIYMPLVAEMYKDMKQVLKYSNEMLWVKDVNETLGELSHDTLQEYSDFNLTGCYINTEAFKKAGMLKTNIDVTFNYEFLLRFTQGRTIKAIPYVLYNHRNGREGSLMQIFNEYHPSELQYWFNVAKEEYHFETQRELNRVESE